MTLLPSFLFSCAVLLSLLSASQNASRYLPFLCSHHRLSISDHLVLGEGVQTLPIIIPRRLHTWRNWIRVVASGWLHSGSQIYRHQHRPVSASQILGRFVDLAQIGTKLLSCSVFL